jgi:hypothetical protein
LVEKKDEDLEIESNVSNFLQNITLKGENQRNATEEIEFRKMYPVKSEYPCGGCKKIFKT